MEERLYAQHRQIFLLQMLWLTN